MVWFIIFDINCLYGDTVVICPKCNKGTLRKEYLGGMDTGDYVCNHCDADTSTEKYRELREKEKKD